MPALVRNGNRRATRHYGRSFWERLTRYHARRGKDALRQVLRRVRRRKTPRPTNR